MRCISSTVIGLVLLLVSGLVCALEGLQIHAQGMGGMGWHTGPISLEFELGDGEGLAFTLKASAMRLPAPLHEARKAQLRCPSAQLVAGHWQCSKAIVSIEFGDREMLRLQASVSLDVAQGSLSLSVKDQPFAGGMLSLALSSQQGTLDVKARFAKLSLMTLQQLAALLGGTLPVAVSAGQVSGTVSVTQIGSARVARVTVQIDQGAFSDANGSHAGEGLQLKTEWRARMKPDDGIWHFEASSSLDSGVIYMAPLLLDMAAIRTAALNSVAARIPVAPVVARLRGQWRPDGGVQIDELEFRDAQALHATASMHLVTVPKLEVRAFAINVPEQPLAAIYARYLQPFAGTGMGADLRVQGAVSAQIDWSVGRGGPATIASRVRLNAVDVGDAQGQFSILGLDGEVFWRSAAGSAQASTDMAGASAAPAVSVVPEPLSAGPPSTLQWQSAQLRALELGAGALHVRLVGRGVDLLAPLEVELLDGALQLEALQGRAMGTSRQHLEMQLSVLPISLQRLSDRLAWLPLSGSISGRIPRLILSADTLRVDGDVHMDLFDGNVRIANLQVMHPWTAVSRLHADVFVDGIDLGVLSRAFSFGQILGRLDGEVRDLVLESWQPVAFDAVLATPVDDPSRHRISQRAVDNLASLGGVQAVLSSTFLRFFKEFSYARLGLRCRLRRGTCEMGGVAPAAQGYYIVEGGGMPPRVDVVGFNRRVDWQTLLDRLKAVAASSGPIIR